MPASTVSAVLTRIGLGRLSRLERPEAPNRYERRRAGELLHIDVKKLVRIAGAGHRVTGSRRGQAQGIAGSSSPSTMQHGSPTSRYSTRRRPRPRSFLRRAVVHFATYGIRIERVMSDNGPAYRSTIDALACRTLRIATCAPGPSASSARSLAAGPTVRSTEAQPSGHERSPAGSASTIAPDHTAPSAANRHSRDSRPS